MIKRQLAGPLFLALLLGSAVLVAQEVPDAASPQAANPPAEKTTAAPQTPAANGQVKKSAPTTTGKDSPFDYRSSEEISEDVPVSFPVDI
jgi:hypothetical protein